MSERKTAAEWHAKLDEIIKHDPDVDSDYVERLMAALAACERERDTARIAAQELLRSYDKEHARAEKAGAEVKELKAEAVTLRGLAEESRRDDELVSAELRAVREERDRLRAGVAKAVGVVVGLIAERDDLLEAYEGHEVGRKSRKWNALIARIESRRKEQGK